MKYKNLTLNIENNAQLYPLFLTLIDMIPFIAPLDKLIDDATKEGPITIDFVNRAESPTGGHFSQVGEMRGHQRTLKRFIKVVSEGKTFAQMLETLVFELCNAKNPHFELFSENGINAQDYDRDSYAYMKESAEYSETHVPSRAILKAIFSDADVIHMFGTVGIQFNRHELFQMTATTFKSFDDWWQHVNQRQPGQPLAHADIYRQQHDETRGRAPAAPRRELPVQLQGHSIQQGLGFEQQPITHHRNRGRGEHHGWRHHERGPVEVIVIDEAELLAQADILASIQARRGRPN